MYVQVSAGGAILKQAVKNYDDFTCAPRNNVLFVLRCQLYEPPPLYTGENGPLVLLAFFPKFYSIFSQKLTIFPLKRSVLGVWKGHFQAWKGQTVNSGLQEPKTSWNSYKTRETSQDRNSQGLASI